MARFIIADLSDPKSIPHEFAHIVPLLPSVPIKSLIVRPQQEYAMFDIFSDSATFCGRSGIEMKAICWLPLKRR